MFTVHIIHHKSLTATGLKTTLHTDLYQNITSHIQTFKNKLNYSVMANSALRKEVLRCFKNLHRTRQQVFEGDENALQLGRNKINEEFKKNKHVSEVTAVAELVQYSKAVENELRCTVIQAKEVKPGVFEARIRPETVKLDNVPFKDM